jgi:Arc/MetJ-type ribon-helix-helix transcriptional regulator
MEDRQQINVRLTSQLMDKLDEMRVALKPSFGKIPTRSEVVRYALEKFFSQSPGNSGSPPDNPTPTVRAKTQRPK